MAEKRRRRRVLLSLLTLVLLVGLPCLPWPLPRADLLPDAPPVVWEEAPVFAVPVQDPTSLLAVYVTDLPDGGRALNVEFSDEDHPCAPCDNAYDLIRLAIWGRVVDVEMLELHPDGLVLPNTAALGQAYGTWIPRHHDERVPLGALARRGRRPVIYVRTWNHLLGAEGEPGVNYVFRDDVPLRRASRAELEASARCMAGREPSIEGETLPRVGQRRLRLPGGTTPTHGCLTQTRIVPKWAAGWNAARR